MKNTVIVSIALFATLGLHHDANAETLIKINDFSSGSGYQLKGVAQEVDKSIQLSTEGDANKNTVGAIWFDTPVDVTNWFLAVSSG